MKNNDFLKVNPHSTLIDFRHQNDMKYIFNNMVVLSVLPKNSSDSKFIKVDIKRLLIIDIQMTVVDFLLSFKSR